MTKQTIIKRKEVKFVSLDDDDKRKSFLNEKTLIKIITQCLKDESKVHNLDNFQKGLFVVGIIKGLVYSGIWINPFLSMDLVTEVKNYGKIRAGKRN